MKLQELYLDLHLLTHKLRDVNPNITLGASRASRITRGGYSVLFVNVQGAETLDSINAYIKVSSDIVVLPSSSYSAVSWIPLGGGVYQNTIYNPTTYEYLRLAIQAPANKYVIGDQFEVLSWIDTAFTDLYSADNRDSLTIRVVAPYDPI